MPLVFRSLFIPSICWMYPLQTCDNFIFSFTHLTSSSDVLWHSYIDRCHPSVRKNSSDGDNNNMNVSNGNPDNISGICLRMLITCILSHYHQHNGHVCNACVFVRIITKSALMCVSGAW